MFGIERAAPALENKGAMERIDRTYKCLVSSGHFSVSCRRKGPFTDD